MFDIQIEIGKMNENRTISWESRLANQLNDNRSEFYQGATAGLKPELTFEINDFEYNNEGFVRFDGNVYSIIRAAKRDDMRELICSTYVGVVV